jgi:crotonobetainyl-CoA:carnitine CoA-transferase CaiB-like acyl-CoA transferase
MNADNPAHQPLGGMRVVEIGTSVAAPYVAWILGALGAEVVKVERPGHGDDARQWGRLFPDGRSSFFLAMNQNKLGITVDLKDPLDREWLRAYCVREADVVIQNMRPGRVEANGLGAVDLIAGNDRLVYCNMGAFGKVGPLKDQAGYDPLMQAFGGLMTVTGEPDRPPVRVGVSLIDMGTGLWSAIGILSALLRREQTGKGCVVDTSLYETALAWLTNAVATVQVDNQNPERLGSGARGIAPYQAYRCRDGYLVVAAPNDRLFERLCSVLELPMLPIDTRFNSNQLRFKNLSELNATLEPVFEARSRQHWQTRLDASGIPNSPVQSVLEMMAHEQTEALGMLQQLDTTEPKLMGVPLSFDGQRPQIRSMAPALGEHNEQIKVAHDAD